MKKRMHIWLVALLISALVVSGAGAWLKYEFLEGLGIQTEENIVSLPFVLVTDAQLRYLVETRMEAAQETAPETEPTETVPQETVPEETVPAETVPATVPETEPTVVMETTEPTAPPEPVDESWFDDVLFIGESRTKGLQNMGRLGDACYFSAGALTIYELMQVKAEDRTFAEQSLASLLASRNFGKIYIHFGINELGGVLNMDNFVARYQWIIDMLREAQPDAYIILQAMLPVSSGYSTRDAFRIESIDALNAKIEELAQGDMLRFSNTNAGLCDEEGYLREELTVDGCHLNGPGYQEWAQLLLEEAASLNIPDTQ